MIKTSLLWILLGGVALASAVAACGSPSTSAFTGTGGASTGSGGTTMSSGSVAHGGGGASSSSSGATGGGGSSGCKIDADCNDGFACTIDTCFAGACSHAVGPNSGPTACPAGQFCEVHSGCVPGVVCATTAQCTQKLGSDACKTNIRCDPALSICEYDLLDKDGDGHTPLVCGGDDCNDDDPTIYAGAPELCDGKDNDCNSKTDDGATCLGLATCQAGGCLCPPKNTCGAECVDKDTDPDHCGSCFNVCSSGATCTGGQCVCSANATMCGGECVDTKTDPLNCNGCGNTCAAGFACQQGTCTCTKTSCGGACVDTTSDPSHCGNCATICAVGAACQAGACKCPPGLRACSGTCVDTKTDENNCGGCGVPCNGACVGGTCTTCPESDLYLAFDKSGSMSTAGVGGSRWDVARLGINAFMGEPNSAGLGLGLGYFGVPPTTTGTNPCTTDIDCLFSTGGVCVGGFCTDTSDSCVPADYAVPVVPIALLPGIASTITASMSTQTPDTATPQSIALQGALTYAKAFAIANPTHRVGVLLLTDGLPNECSPNIDATDTAAVAAQFQSGTPPIPTYVIGLAQDATQAQWTQIAAAGGTGTAYFAPSPSLTEVQTALDNVRNAFRACP